MSVIYLPGAMRDLRGIALWYAKHLPEGEARFFARLRATLGRVERAPESFPLAIESLGVRKARVLRSAYAVAYLVRPRRDLPRRRHSRSASAGVLARAAGRTAERVG